VPPYRKGVWSGPRIGSSSSTTTTIRRVTPRYPTSRRAQPPYLGVIPLRRGGSDPLSAATLLTAAMFLVAFQLGRLIYGDDEQRDVEVAER